MEFLLLKGIALGISLSFMIGPLLFGLVETSLVKGHRAGLAVASGMWVGDVLYIAAIIFGVDRLANLTHQPNFYKIASIAGGSMLLIFGLCIFFSKKQTTELEAVKKKKGSGKNSRNLLKLLKFYAKGFFLNIINPGTVFFWLGISVGLVIPSRWSALETITFFSGMMLTLIATDTLKILAAKRLRKFLTPHHIQVVQKIMGVALVICGILMILK